MKQLEEGCIKDVCKNSNLADKRWKVLWLLVQSTFKKSVL